MYTKINAKSVEFLATVWALVYDFNYFFLEVKVIMT